MKNPEPVPPLNTAVHTQQMAKQEHTCSVLLWQLSPKDPTAATDVSLWRCCIKLWQIKCAAQQLLAESNTAQLFCKEVPEPPPLIPGLSFSAFPWEAPHAKPEEPFHTTRTQSMVFSTLFLAVPQVQWILTGIKNNARDNQEKSC